MRSENAKIKKEIEHLRNENEVLRERLNSLEEKITVIKREIKTEVLQEITDKVKDVLTDIKEREEKKTKQPNLIIYNAPEPRDASVESEDLELCNKLFKEGIKINQFHIRTPRGAMSAEPLVRVRLV